MKQILCILLYSFFCISVFANLTQSHWRWRNNNGSETTATWKANQDSSIKINDFTSLRLRMEVYSALSDTKPFDHGLQYASSVNGPWYSISDATEINAFVFAGDTAFIANNEPTTHQLKKTKYNFVPGNIITNQSAATDSIAPNTSREYEWSIKPAKNIQPFTDYYFKAASGDAPSSPPSLSTGNAFTAKPVFIANGGFENNLNNWTTTTANGSAASFLPSTAEYHTGTKTLQVYVTNKSSTNSVKLTHRAIPARTAGLYLLRFWAIAKNRNALLTVNLKTSAGDNTCNFKIYDRFDTTKKTGWQMYQYAFKVAASPVSLEFNFNTNTTYYLDDVEIIAGNDPTIDVQTQYNWQYNQAPYGWLSGDNDNSVLLPDGSVAWIFSDSFMGNTNAHSNIIGSAPIINNLIVHEVKDQYTSIYKGTSSSPQSLFSPGNGNIFWNSGGVVENNTLKVLLIEIGNNNYQNNTYVGLLSLPDLVVQGQVKTSYHGANAPNTIFQDGAYNYLYIGERVGTFENYTQVARVPAGSLSSPTIPWEFYTNNDTWSTDYTQAKRILAGVEAASVVKLSDNNYALSGVPNLSSEIAVWFATSPVGPWVNKTVIYNIPQEEGVLAYEGHIDKGSGKNGIYTLSYSVYPFGGYVAQQLSDKGIYIPYYVKANLKKLSPFSGKTVLNVPSIESEAVPKTEISRRK